MIYRLLNSLKKITLILLRGIIICFLLSLIYFFYTEQVSVFEFSVKNPFFKYVKSIEWWKYLIICFIVLSVLNVIVLGILNLYYTTKRIKDERLKNHYNSFFTKYLIDYLFPAYSNNIPQVALIKKLKKRIKTKMQIVSLFSIYTRIQENVALDIKENFIDLLDKLFLRKYIKKFLMSNDFSDIILALKIINYLQIKDYNRTILRYTSSKNYALRTEAIATFINLKEKGNLSILMDYSYQLSLLDVNVIINALLKNDRISIDFEPLFNATDPNKILISVLIAKHKKKTKYLNEIKNLIGYPNEMINFELWDTFLTLAEDEDCMEFILSSFSLQSEKIKLLILSKNLNLKKQKYIDFIIQIVQNDKSLYVKAKSLRILIKQRFDKVPQFYNSSDINIIKAYNEAIDFNII